MVKAIRDVGHRWKLAKLTSWRLILCRGRGDAFLRRRHWMAGSDSKTLQYQATDRRRMYGNGIACVLRVVLNSMGIVNRKRRNIRFIFEQHRTPVGTSKALLRAGRRRRRRRNGEDVATAG